MTLDVPGGFSEWPRDAQRAFLNEKGSHQIRREIDAMADLSGHHPRRVRTLFSHDDLVRLLMALGGPRAANEGDGS